MLVDIRLVYIYIYIYIYIYVRVCVSVCISIYLSIYLYKLYVFTCSSIYIYVEENAVSSLCLVHE